MAAHLVPCPGCQRHVRVSEAACPFCGGVLAEELRQSAPSPMPSTRLARAALFAFRASVTGATVVAAGSVAVGATIACNDMEDDGGAAQPIYGTPFVPTAGSGGTGGSDGGDSGVNAGGAAGHVDAGDTDAGSIDVGNADAGDVDAGPDAGDTDAG